MIDSIKAQCKIKQVVFQGDDEPNAEEELEVGANTLLGNT